jgi:hypothetical protein
MLHLQVWYLYSFCQAQECTTNLLQNPKLKELLALLDHIDNIGTDSAKFFFENLKCGYIDFNILLK